MITIISIYHRFKFIVLCIELFWIKIWADNAFSYVFESNQKDKC